MYNFCHISCWISVTIAIYNKFWKLLSWVSKCHFFCFWNNNIVFLLFKAHVCMQAKLIHCKKIDTFVVIWYEYELWCMVLFSSHSIFSTDLFPIFWLLLHLVSDYEATVHIVYIIIYKRRDGLEKIVNIICSDIFSVNDFGSICYFTI